LCFPVRAAILDSSLTQVMEYSSGGILGWHKSHNSQ
jgi:hypothetical protein